MGSRIKHRRDTSANLAAANPILADGELGYAKDTRVLKMGDGVNTWQNLPRLVLDSNGTNGDNLLKLVKGVGFEYFQCAASTNYTVQHGLGRVPDLVIATYRIAVALSGWAVNDELKSVHAIAPSISADETTLRVVTSSSSMQIPPKTGGAVVNIAYANWRLRVQCFKFDFSN